MKALLLLAVTVAFLFVCGIVDAARRNCPAPCRTLTNVLTDRVADTEKRIESILKKVDDIEDDVTSVYTRWGRTHCPIGTTLVYKGVTGGSYYSQTGGAVNYLCMPHDPQFGKTTKGLQNCGGFVWGVEYRTCATNDPYKDEYLDDMTLNLNDVPCAICETPRPNSLMIPARTECPHGWTEEYQGYLMSSYYGHQRAQFICVDQKPEVSENGNVKQNGALLYAQEARCGSLSCPNYAEGMEMSCIVCTQ